MNAKTLMAGVAASAAAMAFSLPASATTAISGAVNVVANSSINNVTTTDGPHSASWSGVPTALGAGAGADAVNGTDSVATHGRVDATWTSADAGSVTFTNYGWDFDVTDPSTTQAGSDLTQGRGGDDWSYTFQATQNGTIALNYSVAGIGNTFGLWGWSVDWNGPGGGQLVNNASDPTENGVFTRTLTAGQTYTIGLNGNPNVSFAGATGVYSGDMDGDFSFLITGAGGVPEPATWALMLFGLGGVGAGLRLNRSKSGLASAH